MKKTFTFHFILLSVLLPFFVQAAQITLPQGVTTIGSYKDTEVVIPDKAELHLTSATPLENSTVNLETVDSWVFFDNVKPSKVISDYISSVKINGSPFVEGTNGRVGIYAHGTVLMPHAEDFKPLTVYKGENFTGESLECNLHTYHNNLGDFDNTIKSFKLKRGYMATFATASNGTGYSRVFTADDKDIEIAVMPDVLNETVSFIRVFKYQWVTKKGWGDTGGAGSAELLNCTWFYAWNAGYNTTPNMEFVPQKHKAHWPGWDEIDSKTNVTHVLGLNEPDKEDQANITYSAAMAMMPSFYKSGLRVTSPVASDFYNGWGEAAFIRECDEKNYRIDATHVHAYQARNWWYTGRIDDISNRTNGRTLWITEWNNGANWTTESWPSGNRKATDANVQKQLDDIKYILNILDSHPKVERYAFYNWVEDCRAMILTINDGWKADNPGWENYQWLKTAPVLWESGGSKGVLTPAGAYYRDHKAPIAYNKANDIIPVWKTLPPAILSTVLREDNTQMRITLQVDGGNELNKSYILEQSINNGRYEQVDEISNRPVSNVFDFDIDISQAGTYSFRLRAKGMANEISEPSVESNFVITSQDEINAGNASVSRSDWNTMYFGHVYENIPAVILGTPGYNNPYTLMTMRVQNTKKDQLKFKLEPWRYLGQTVYPKAETLPYLILPTGIYDFKGINACVNSGFVTGNWSTVKFDVPDGYFSEPPVIIPTQSSARNLPPTSIHIKNVTTTGFDICLRKEATQTGSVQYEYFDYIALSVGEGQMNDKKIYTGKVDGVGSSNYSTKEIKWNEPLENALIYTHKQSANDEYASNTRMYTRTNKSAKVFNQIERSGTVTSPATETVGWLVIGDADGLSIDQNKIKDKDVLHFYPNPATDYIYLDNGQQEELNVRILTMQGSVVMSRKLTDNKIDVSNLSNGLYIISINGKSAIMHKN